MSIKRIKVASKSLLFFLGCVFFLSFNAMIFSVTEVAAENRYVIPSAEVVLRAGAGREYKVTGMVKDGDSVEFLKEDESYALVRLRSGKEGWMMKRFLSIDPPLSTIVESLRAENEKLKEREIEITQKFEEVSANLSKAETDLNSILNERNQITSDFQALQQDTADVIQIKEDMLKATRQNEVLVQEMISLKEENTSLKKDSSINWFIAGGGVLLVGMFLGRLSSKSRKRKSSLM